MPALRRFLVLLSVVAAMGLATAACSSNDDDDDDKGAAGSGVGGTGGTDEGEAGSGGTDEGEAGSGGTDEGEAGSGGTDEGEAGTGGTDEGEAGTGGGFDREARCTEMCDAVYDVCEQPFDDGWAELTKEECNDFCRLGVYTKGEIECYSTSACEDIHETCKVRAPTTEECDAMCDHVYDVCESPFDDDGEPASKRSCQMICSFGGFNLDEVQCFTETSCEGIHERCSDAPTSW